MILMNLRKWPMDLNQDELQQLQEKLILIYKFVKQEKMYQKFFFEGIEFEKSFKYKNKLINQLLEMENPEEFLKECILELEELKTGEKLEKKVSLIDVLEKQDLENLYYKYGVKDIYDVDKLDIKDVLKLF